MFELLLDFTGKAMATALVLFLVSRIAEKLGPFMASVLMAMPMNAGPDYFFDNLGVSPQFLSKGALMSFAATGGVLVFTGFYIQANTQVLIFGKYRNCKFGLAGCCMDFRKIGSKFSERHDHGDGRFGDWDNDAQTFGFVFKPEFIFKEMEYYPPPVGGKRSFSSIDCHNSIHVRP